MERLFLTPEEVAEDIHITVEQSRQLIKLMRKQLAGAGYLTVPDRIQKWYYQEQRASGFASPRRILGQAGAIPLNERRLLSMKEFSNYTSLGKDSAAELARVSGAVFYMGRRILVDRVKFDCWCDEHTGIGKEE